ncbi:MAG: hypothetical protein ABIH46_08190 [Chloroflexota bacterium]
MARTDKTQAEDPVAGSETTLLNAMLSLLIPKAQIGDEAAMDRVIKILELKRKLKSDAEEEWQGAGG